MCLPFQGLEQTVVPPNEKSRQYVSNLKILLWCQLVLSIFELFVGFWDSSDVSKGYSAIYELIGCCILYCAYNQLNYCSCIIFIFIGLFAMVSDFVIVGKYIQNQNDLFNGKYSNARNISMALNFISFFYYIVAIYAVFLAYREFKALSNEGGQFMQRNDSGQDDDYGYGAAYGGYGGQQGGYQQQPPPQYQAQPPAQPQEQRAKPAQSNVFAGQGVRIGGS